MDSPVADELVGRLAAYQQNGHATEDGATLIRSAYAVAREAHESQKRVSGEPYIDHPVAVAGQPGFLRHRVSVAGGRAVIANLVPMIDLNPFHWLGDQVKESLADTFTSMMMALWSAALWLMDLVFSVLDRFLTPDVTDPGLNHLYGVTLWLSLVMALVIGFGQIGLAAVRRDGQTLGALAMGIVQYGAVVAGWVVVCGGLIVGCAGLTRGPRAEDLQV